MDEVPGIEGAIALLREEIRRSGGFHKFTPRIGASYATVYAWVTGIHVPSERFRVALRDVVGIPVEAWGVKCSPKTCSGCGRRIWRTVPRNSGGEALRALIRQTSRRDVARRCGIRPGRLYEFVSGQRKPGSQTRSVLASLGIEPSAWDRPLGGVLQ